MMNEMPHPGEIDRLLVQQYDVSVVTIGGIDTCIRGLLNYAPWASGSSSWASTSRTPASRLGIWERHQRGDRHIWFLPVARIDMQGKGASRTRADGGRLLRYCD